jgi:hypothetical protein
VVVPPSVVVPPPGREKLVKLAAPLTVSVPEPLRAPPMALRLPALAAVSSWRPPPVMLSAVGLNVTLEPTATLPPPIWTVPGPPTLAAAVPTSWLPPAKLSVAAEATA